MGKSSSSSCLKIIVCGSDSAQTDDIHSTSEAKPSSDKRGWSFRKKSGKNRVLGNNVSSETTTFAIKDAPQGGNVEFQPPIKSAIVDEKLQAPKHVEEICKPVVLSESYSEPKPSMEMVTPEMDTTTESKVSQDEVALKSISNETSDEESKVSQDKVALKSISNETSDEESKVSQDEVALKSISNETSAEYKMVDVAVGPENDGNETSDNSSLADESFVLKDESIESAEPKKSEPEMAPESGCDAGVSIDEPVAIIMQTAMRGFLAQKEFMRLKSAVKLQAVIRGHLVRRNAVATLHCIRAIVKVQALVRARSSKSLKNKPDGAQFSTVKLLQNSFTRQLLESTSKPKSLTIKCDPMRPNSAWSWLERWMAVSTSEASEKLEPSVEPEIENENEVQKVSKQADTELSSVALSESIALLETTDSKFSEKGEKSMENDENNIIDDVKTVDFSTVHPFSTEVINEPCHLQKHEIDYKDVASATTVVNAIEISGTQAKATFLEDKTDIPATGEIEQLKPAPPAMQHKEIEQPKLSAKRSATSELNDEGNKFTYGSRKASNPAFIAAQSKFEELTLAANSDRATSPSLEESVKKTNHLGDVEHSGTFNPQQIHVAGSECGTELSISSTLDSPSRSEIENVEVRPEVQFVKETSRQHDAVKHDYEANGISTSSADEIPSITIREGEVGETKSVSVVPIASEVIPQVEEILETKPSDVEIDFLPESSVTDMDSSQVAVDQKHQENGYKTPEASPISHREIPESQGTPSSQASVKGKRNKIDKHGSYKKRSSPYAEKQSPSNSNIDSAARSSTEHLPKDHKSGKRRNSFGSAKSDNADQEARDSSNRNSLPSYMQATESARAKANSPRSSPDVHDKEVYSKKRHSLPGATGKQSSNVHRSTPQAASGAKANGSHPSNERKWLR